MLIFGFGGSVAAMVVLDWSILEISAWLEAVRDECGYFSQSCECVGLALCMGRFRV